VSIEGEIVVRLECELAAVRRVRIRSTRPFAASRVLVGRTPVEAASTLPLLYSVCARAQGAAAAGALEAAEGVAAPPATLAEREFAVVRETVEECLRRVLVDWPAAMGHSAATEPVAAARRLAAARCEDAQARAAFGRALSEIAARYVYGSAPADWLALADDDALDAWAGRVQTLPARLLAELLRMQPTLGRSEVTLMPEPGRARLESAVLPALRAVAGFEAAPLWDGAPVETGALARMRAHPLVASVAKRCGNSVPARMAARLVELAALLARLAGTADAAAAPGICAFPLGPGEGLAAVQTARGLLLHHARVAEGRVAGYRIVAPTEWNFHPDGPLARGLAGLAAANDAALERSARLAAQALDPCVACRIEVAHA
jgi:hypothetical protein